MSMDVQTSMRLPSQLLERADKLIDSLQLDPSLAMMGKMTRSKVLRLALSEGLRVLEERHMTTDPRRPRSNLPRAREPKDQSPEDSRIDPRVSVSSSHTPASYVPMEED